MYRGENKSFMLRQVIPLEGRLRLNMGNRLNANRFCPLKDNTVLNSVTTDGYHIHFDVKPNNALAFTLREELTMSVSTPGTSLCESKESESEDDKS